MSLLLLDFILHLCVILFLSCILSSPIPTICIYLSIPLAHFCHGWSAWTPNVGISDAIEGGRQTPRSESEYKTGKTAVSQSLEYIIYLDNQALYCSCGAPHRGMTIEMSSMLLLHKIVAGASLFIMNTNLCDVLMSVCDHVVVSIFLVLLPI